MTTHAIPPRWQGLTTAIEDALPPFAGALTETPAFQAFETAAAALRDDAVARCTIDAYEQRQHSLRALLQLGAVSAEDQAELERLRQAYLDEPSVSRYLTAQADLVALAQAVADQLSAQIGFDFAASCGGGCCG